MQFEQKGSPMNQHDETDPKPRRRGVARVAAVLATAAFAMIGVATTAAAATPCANRVCLYDGDGQPIGAYQDITDDFQSFDRTRTASAFNGFGDNAVYFLYKSDTTSCMQPQRTASLVLHTDDPVVGIMIRPGGNCYPDGEIR
jgi:hypothetical protein